MRACYQFREQDVLEHGLAVTCAFAQVMKALETGTQPEGWRLPSWLLEPATRTHFLAALLPAETLYWYQLFHDCGKPMCRTIDEEGRQHFPGHAEASEAQWLACGGVPDIGRLMGLDMAMHTANAEEMAALCRLPEAASLYLTALAEIHANAPMFGGFDSTSFKMKAKHLDRRGRQLLR
ncbi:hypothetical protein [Paraburkholderia sp. A3RO-2L]|jgi:hypothetical protein|uniref:hypothetical protein n=1 Tax=Paraburkholderia sp. A3RO-2L TaxID=3028376 RepID=UPI003DA9B9D2